MTHQPFSPLEPRLSIDSVDVVCAVIKQRGYALCQRLPGLSESQLLDFASRIGSLELGIDQELSGPPVMHLKFDATKTSRSDRPAYFSSQAFPLHSDLAYVANPPRYLFTLCVQPDPNGGGHTLLSDCFEAWQVLSREHQLQLEKSQFRFRNPPNTPVGTTNQLPLCLVADDGMIFRYRLDSMLFPSEADDAVAYFSAALNAGTVSIPLSSGDLLIVDNHRMLHGRTAFSPPENSSSKRHLLRTYAQDQSRSTFLCRINKPTSTA